MENGCYNLQSNRNNIFHEIYNKANSDKNLPPKFPYFIDVELTNKCNLSCRFCSRQFMKRSQGFMNDTTFNKILQEIEDTKIPIRFIRWGEPFLNPNILKYSLELTERGIPLHITTNGQLFKHEIIYSEPDSIIFSMQGTNPKEYENNRKADYDTLKKNIIDLCKLRGNDKKPYITINTTIDKTEGKDRKKFVEYWKKYVDEVNIGITNLSRINGSCGNHIICKIPWQQLSIDWDGNVSACCSDYDRLLNIGNIHSNSLSEMWNSKLLNAYRTIISSGKHDSLSLCKYCYPAHGDIWKS